MGMTSAAGARAAPLAAAAARARARRYADIWRGIQRYAMDPVYLHAWLTLLAITGVLKRTLWNVCKKFTDLPPIAHIKSKRMVIF